MLAVLYRPSARFEWQVVHFNSFSREFSARQPGTKRPQRRRFTPIRLCPSNRFAAPAPHPHHPRNNSSAIATNSRPTSPAFPPPPPRYPVVRPSRVSFPPPLSSVNTPHTLKSISAPLLPPQLPIPHTPLSPPIACTCAAYQMSDTFTAPDDWLLAHHARDALSSPDSSNFSSLGIQKDHSVPIDTLFRSRWPRQSSPTSAPLSLTPKTPQISSCTQQQQQQHHRRQTPRKQQALHQNLPPPQPRN